TALITADAESAEIAQRIEIGIFDL
ncbi:MAG: hypothetical protein QOH42_2516, partial [Blastocatellia bacterium]|nr:hypothetical protein [Blastocatellia bacterium]